MSLETLTFQDELQELKDAKKNLMTKFEAWEKHVNDPEVFWKKPDFDKLTSDLEVSCETVEEARAAAKPIMPAPFEAFPQQGDQNGQNGNRQQQSLDVYTKAAEAQQGNRHMYARAAVAIAIFVVCGLLAAIQIPIATIASDPAYPTTVLPNGTVVTNGFVTSTSQGVLPVSWFIVIIAASLALLFGIEQIKSLWEKLAEKKAEEETSGSASLDWIVEQFNYIRERYTSACLMIEVKTNSSGAYQQKKFFETTLPTDFLSRVTRVIVACKTDDWKKKQVLINAIAVSRSAGVGH